jgi:hypothetical protein
VAIEALRESQRRKKVSMDELSAVAGVTKTSTEDTLDTYGVKYASHSAIWISKENVIRIVEHPGTNASTEVLAETIRRI